MSVFKFIFLVIISVFLFTSCNKKSEIKGQEDISKVAKAVKTDEYYTESEKIFEFLIDSVMLKESVIFDTLCYWDRYNEDLVRSAIYTAKTLRSLYTDEDAQYVLGDFKNHQRDDIKKMIKKISQTKLLAKIDSTAPEDKIFYRYPRKRPNNLYTFSAPMFNKKFDKCMIFMTEMKQIEGQEQGVRHKGEYFIHLQKKNSVWENVNFTIVPNN